MNADVALITSKNVVYMVKYTQKLNESSFDFSFYRYWQYKDIASLRQYGLGNNTVVNIGKFISVSPPIPFLSIVHFRINKIVKSFQVDSFE